MTEAMQLDAVREENRSGNPIALQSPTPTPTQSEESLGPLLPQDSVQDFRNRWDRLQTTFVDEPRTAVEQADELVKNAIQRLSESFSEARTNLEQQWGRGDQVNTEDLRLALRKYRAFFHRILAV